MLFTKNTTATTIVTKVIHIKIEQVMVYWLKKLTGQSIVQHRFQETHRTGCDQFQMQPSILHTPYTSNPAPFHYPNNIWWRVQIMNLPTIKFSLASSYSIPGPNIPLSNLLSGTFGLYSSHNMWDTVSLYTEHPTLQFCIFFIFALR